MAYHSRGRKFRQFAPGGRRSERSEVIGLALPTVWIHQSSGLCSSVSHPRNDFRVFDNEASFRAWVSFETVSPLDEYLLIGRAPPNTSCRALCRTKPVAAPETGPPDIQMISDLPPTLHRMSLISRIPPSLRVPDLLRTSALSRVRHALDSIEGGGTGDGAGVHVMVGGR
ncbi:hypothetical protein U1Q18_031131 [Sarracenia purpurea var. burkii]